MASRRFKLFLRFQILFLIFKLSLVVWSDSVEAEMHAWVVFKPKSWRLSLEGWTAR